jgi:ribosomal protein S5
MNSHLQQTVFSVEKIRNVVNVGRCSAYHIYTTPGDAIGYLGHLEMRKAENAANDVRYVQDVPATAALLKPSSWFK